MADDKTSAELAREHLEKAAVGDLFAASFGGEDALHPIADEVAEQVEELQEEEPLPEEVESPEQESASIDDEDSLDEPQDVESTEEDLEETSNQPTELPSGPPSGPPTGPPSPPSGPPSGPPAGPPTPPPGPPNPPSGPPSGPPTGPPTPPSAPPSPPSGPPSPPENQEDAEEIEESEVHEEVIVEEIPEEPEEEPPEEPNEEIVEETQDDELNPPSIDDLAKAKEEEIARLSEEVARLRSSLAGAADIIEEIEEVPVAPMVADDFVVEAHLVADISRMGRHLQREGLVHSTAGSIAMLHPDQPGLMVGTKHQAPMGSIMETNITGTKLGANPPVTAPPMWKVMEIILASASLENGGPAACVHVHPPYTTAVSCEKDLILCQPVDEAGKQEIGKVVIVEPDDEDQEEFLRHTAEALKQGGMKCVVVRGHGAFAVGRNLDEAWRHASMLEHSMQIVLLARQANLKV